MGDQDSEVKNRLKRVKTLIRFPNSPSENVSTGGGEGRHRVFPQRWRAPSMALAPSTRMQMETMWCSGVWRSETSFRAFFGRRPCSFGASLKTRSCPAPNFGDVTRKLGVVLAMCADWLSENLQARDS